VSKRQSRTARMTGWYKTYPGATEGNSEQRLSPMYPQVATLSARVTDRKVRLHHLNEELKKTAGRKKSAANILCQVKADLDALRQETKCADNDLIAEVYAYSAATFGNRDFIWLLGPFSDYCEGREVVEKSLNKVSRFYESCVAQRKEP
jgi:hypothetical protein